MYSKMYLTWQFLAVLIFFIALLLAYANIKKQKEINVCYLERLSLIRKCNKLMVELLQLRTQLRTQSQKVFELEEKLLEK